MSFKFDKSSEGYEDNLALFSAPPFETATLQKTWQDFRPVTQLSKGSTLHFTIPGTSSDYINLRETRLYLKCRINKSDGTRITKDDKTAFVNLPLYSCFRQCDVSLNQNVITPSVGLNYPYKAMFDTLLKFDEESKETQLQGALYYKDTAGDMDSSDTEAGGNLGLLERSAWTENGQSVDLEGPIYMDICQQKRLILNGVQVDIKLFPHSDSFPLMSATPDKMYQYEIQDAILKVCYVKVNAGVLIGHSEALKKSPAIYPYHRSDVKVFNIANGSYNFSADDIFQGEIPSRVIVALTSGAAYSGSYTKNPFNFHHHNANFVGFYVDGQSVPGPPLQPNYSGDKYVSSYLSTFTATGKYLMNEGNYISRKQFKDGYCMYVFDIEGKHGKEFMNLVRRGHTRLTIRFQSATTDNVCVLVYGKTPAILEIDETRNILK